MPFPIARARRTLAAGAAVAAGLALTAAHAHAAYTPTIEDRTLVVTGDAASDKLALRVPANATKILELDVGDDGSADFRIARLQFERIHVLAGDGDDFVRGRKGDDVVRLGAGNDRFDLRPGDGSDALDAAAGTDALIFSGTSANETFDLSANGTRTRLTRDAGSGIEAHEARGVETLSLFSFGGADNVTVRDTTGTGLTTLDLSLFDFGVLGGNQDVVRIEATGGNDDVMVTGLAGGSGVSVTGLAAAIRLTGTTSVGDRLEVAGLAGDDAVDSTALPPDEMQFRGDGGPGDDFLIAGAGDDVLSGSDGADVLFAGSGDNVAFGGAGDDVLRGEEGDDVLDGGADDDVLIGSAGDDVLLNGEVVFDE